MTPPPETPTPEALLATVRASAALYQTPKWTTYYRERQQRILDARALSTGDKRP